MMEKISNKSRDKLYDIVQEEIMQARIKIAKLTNDSPQLGCKVDDVLSDLGMFTPLKAIEVFKPKQQ